MFYCRVYEMVRKVWFQENICAMSTNGLKKRDRSTIVYTEQSEYFLPIYFYVQDTYEDNNSPDQTNKNGERVLLFILAIKILANRLKSRKFVSVMKALFRLLC